MNDIKISPSRIKNIAIVIFMLLCVFAFGDTANTKKVTYVFSAKESSIANKSGIVTLKGEAKVRKNGDYINADQIIIYKDVKTGEIIKMEAIGNVDMDEGGKKSTCKKATFFETEERIEMEGTEDAPAMVDDGKNKLMAPVIIYFRKEDRLEAKAEKGLVNGQIIIEEKEKPAEENK